MISTGDLKKGLTIEFEGQLCNILDWQHVKIGRGGAIVRMKLRNIRSGAIKDGSRTDIAQLHAHNCAAAPDLHVLPVENVAQLALKFNGQTLFQVASRYHGSNSLYLLAFYLFIIASYVNFDHMRVTFVHRM